MTRSGYVDRLLLAIAAKAVASEATSAPSLQRQQLCTPRSASHSKVIVLTDFCLALQPRQWLGRRGCPSLQPQPVSL